MSTECATDVIERIIPHREDRMADKHFDVLESFIAFIKATEEGARIPRVSSDDLQRLYETCEYVARQYCRCHHQAR
jgi:hypothetical protein